MNKGSTDSILRPRTGRPHLLEAQEIDEEILRLVDDPTLAGKRREEMGAP